MARTVADAFDVLLRRLAPSTAETNAAASHRASVEKALRARLDVRRFRQIGSFHHGTGVRHHTDVDLLVSLKGERPSTDAALGRVRRALSASFPTTMIRVNRPAVVVQFAGGTQTWEIIPGFLVDDSDQPVYSIPGFGEWITSAPTAHLDYVTRINVTTESAGGAKSLARLVKAWKYYNNVPVSSFYLEMRAAQHMQARKSFRPQRDLRTLLETLLANDLADMNDPERLTSRIRATSSPGKRASAVSKLRSGANRAARARVAEKALDPVEAFRLWNLVFGGKFPRR